MPTSNNVRVLADDQIITSNQANEQEDNFLIVTPENYRKALEENRKLSKEINVLQNEILLFYKRDVLYIPPPMTVS